MSRRVRVFPYKIGSKSSRLVAEFIGVKRLYNDSRSRFVGRRGDIIINWGNSSGIPQDNGVTYINTPANVALAANKLTTFQKLEQAQVKIPEYTTTRPTEGIWVARTKLSGHSGDGIITGEAPELPYAPLYTKFVDKVAEYRAIVVGDVVVDSKKKLKKSGWTEENGDRNPYVWNVANGYVFARNGWNKPSGFDDLATKAITALGLDFGAVDIIEDNEGTLYVLEVNTAFGIEGTTQELFCSSLKQRIEDAAVI